MRRLGLLAGLGVACLLVAGALAGGRPDPLGRVLLWAGLPRLAEPLLEDPGWRGVAAYRAGHLKASAEAFRAGGDWLNLGNAQVMSEEYAAALESYDRARLRGDARAAANFDLVAAFYAGRALSPEAQIAWFADRDDLQGEPVAAPVAQGSARAASDGSETTNTGALLGLPELASHADPLLQRAVRKVFDETFMVANDRWLATLSDVPGEYLAERIKQEHKRRQSLGLSPPDPEDPR